MRIALFCPDYPPSDRQGGIQDYSQHLARSLSQQGLDVTVFTGQSYAGHGSDGLVNVVNLPGPWDKRWAFGLIEQLENRSVDVINLQYSPAMFENPLRLGWPVLASRFPSVVSFHTLWGGPRRNIIAAWRLLHTAGAVIATNSEILHLLRRYTPRYTRKVFFVPIGSNITPQQGSEIHEEVIHRYDIRKSQCLLVYFGMGYPGKGLELLLDAASYLHRTRRLDFKLLCVGGGVSDVSTYRAERYRRVSELGLENRITWTGRVPASHVSYLLASSHMVVLPFESGVSDRRGSLMAALAHGKPIVTTPPRVRIPHFVNGKNMIWPSAASGESLGRVIVQLHEDRSLRESLSQGALELASKLQWNQIARDTMLCFEKVPDAATT